MPPMARLLLKLRLLLLPPLLLLPALARSQQPPLLPGCFQPVAPVHLSAPVADPDDPAVWISPTNPAESLIVGTDKGTDEADPPRSDGGIAAFATTGALVKRIPLARPNNVDVEYGLAVGGASTDIAVTCERDRQMIRVYRLPSLEPIDGGGLAAFAGEPEQDRRCMGVGVYKRPHDGAIFAIVSRKSGPSGSYLWQYLLADSDGDGVVEATLSRQFGQFSGEGEIEAVAVDDVANRVFYSDEGCCVRAYAADPADDEGQLTADELSSFGHTGFARDREGISIYATGASSPRVGMDEAVDLADAALDDVLAGFLFVSDQQRTGTFRVYCREAPHTYVTSVQLADTYGSDGSEVTPFSLGPGFESGAFIAMSDTGHRFNFYSWASIEPCLGEAAASLCLGAQPEPTGEDSGGEPLLAKFLAVVFILGLATASFRFLYMMIWQEKVLLESGGNSRKYRGEEVARITGMSASKSSLDRLDEERQNLLGTDAARGGATPVGYERHATPVVPAGVSLHGLEPASGSQSQVDRRPEAKRSLELSDLADAGGAEAVLQEAAALAEMRALFRDSDKDSDSYLDRSEVAALCEKVMGSALTEAELDGALASMDVDGSNHIGFEEFKRWVDSLRLPE